MGTKKKARESGSQNRGRTVVLVVDDHAVMRAMIRSVLSPAIFRVVEANDGADVEAAFCRHHPDVVLMDIEMPRMDGIASTRALLALHPEARVVIVTSHADVRNRRAAGDVGALQFVSKDDLMSIAKVISRVSSSHPSGDLFHPSPF